MNKEFEFLKIIKNSLDDSSFIDDDCAYLKEYKLAISQDSLIEDVHFKLSYMTPYETAKKSLLVNISDILASGAKPKYAAISLSGKLNNDFVKEFYRGINDTAKKYNIKIIGGDLTKSEKVTVSITIIGTYKNRRPSSRKNAKEGYIVALKGEFGSSAQGLYNLQNNIKENYFSKIHKEPKLYPEISTKISKCTKHPYAMMDSSDGLLDCLYQISQKSNVKIEIEYSKIPKKTDNKDFVLYGGEDYGLVVCLNEKDFNKIKGLVKIGTCTKGCGVFADNKEVKYKGYNHFEN